MRAAAIMHRFTRASYLLRAGAYVCSSDEYYTRNPFESYEYASTLQLDRKAARTNDMAVGWNAKGVAVSVERGIAATTGACGYADIDADCASVLLDAIEDGYDTPEMEPLHWDDVYAAHCDELLFYVRLLESGMMHEFNFMSDLCTFDRDFLANVDSSILDNICATLACEREDIVRVRPVKAGLTSLSVLFSCKGAQYVYRHPGLGTDEIVNRQAEAHSLAVAKRLGLDDTFVYEDPDQGWKISRYIPGCIEFDYRGPDHVERALALVRRLHESGEESAWQFDFYDEACKIESIAARGGLSAAKRFFRAVGNGRRAGALRTCRIGGAGFVPQRFLRS